MRAPSQQLSVRLAVTGHTPAAAPLPRASPSAFLPPVAFPPLAVAHKVQCARRISRQDLHTEVVAAHKVQYVRRIYHRVLHMEAAVARKPHHARRQEIDTQSMALP